MQRIQWSAFDLNNNVYLETLVATNPDFTTAAVVLSKSTDGGATFASPTVAYQPGTTTVFPDKEWMAINTFGSTATAGRILVTFSSFSNVNANGAPILRTYSTDTGFTWNTAAAISNETNLQGSQPLFLPNGNCVVVYWNFGTGPAFRTAPSGEFDGWWYNIWIASHHRIRD